MITLNGREYPVTFVGDCDIDFNDPISGSSLTTDVFGLDSLSRDYKVRIDRKTYVQNQLQKAKGRPDFEFKTMFMTGWTEREDGPWAIFSIMFRGLFNGKIPDPKFSGGFNLQRAASSMTSGALAGLPALEGASVDIEYLAPFATVKYVRRERPTRPQFTGSIITGDIIYQSIDGESTGLINVYSPRFALDSDRPLEPQNGRYNLKKVVQVKGPTWDQVGIYYECQETHEMILQPFGMANRLNFL